MADPLARFRRFLRELKRRKVYRVAITYVVVAAGAVQLVSVVVPASRLPGWADEFFLAVAVFCFPIAVVLAWAFEVTPEGVKRTEAAEGAPAGTGGYRWVGLAVVLLAAGGFWIATAGGGEEFSEPTDAVRTPPPAGERSIAVLPFENMGGEESEQFTRGMHDGLLTRLFNASGLKVTSRTSVMQFEETDLPLPAIADSLGVTWVMEGGVQRMGDQIQVNAQLIDPRSDTHVWAESYRRDLTAADLFAIQSDITKKIARSLEAELSPEEAERVERRPTEDLEAYRLYVQGRSALNTRTPEGMRQAVGYFRRAIRQDSSYALAWSGLADAAGLYPIYGSGSLPAAVPGQEEAARRALRLDPDLAEAHASMGHVHFQERRGPAGLRKLERAVELKPSYAQAHVWLGLLQLDLGRLEDARRHLSLAVELDPENGAARGVMTFILVASGEPDQAEPHLRRVPPVRRPSHRAFVLYSRSRWDQLERLARRQREADADTVGLDLWRFYLARIAALQGDTAAAGRQLTAIRREEGEERHLQAGLIHAVLGRPGEAFVEWGQIEDWTEPAVLTLRYLYPDVLDPLRGDPRFRELIREANRAWGLNPDGSLPDSVDVSFEAEG